MNLKSIQDVYSRFVQAINFIGLMALFVMMAITTIDVILRKTGTGLSVTGSYELTEMSMVLLVFLGIPVEQIARGHIRVDMLLNKVPNRARYFYESFILLIEIGVGIILVIGAFQKNQRLFDVGTTTDVLRIPQLPFAAIMGFGLILYTLALLLDFF